MDPIAIILIVALVVLLVVVLAVGGNKLKGVNMGTLQSILVILILLFLAIWLGQMVLS